MSDSATYRGIPVFLPGTNRNWEDHRGIMRINKLTGEMSVIFQDPHNIQRLLALAEIGVLMQVAFDYQMSDEKLKYIRERFSEIDDAAKLKAEGEMEVELGNTDILCAETFISLDRDIISHKGENYYRACGDFVYLDDDGTTHTCVRRVGHHRGLVHEAYDGTLSEVVEVSVANRHFPKVSGPTYRVLDEFGEVLYVTDDVDEAEMNYDRGNKVEVLINRVETSPAWIAYPPKNVRDKE